jgi:hypothetical protein
MPDVLTAQPTPRTRRTLSEARNDVARSLNVKGANWLTDADLTFMLNDGQDEVARISRWYRSSWQGGTTANTAQIDLPAPPLARFLAVEEVYHDDQPLLQIRFELLQEYYRRFRTQTAADPRWWAANGNSALYLYPTPTLTEVDILKVYGQALPPYVSQDEDKLYVPHGLENAILDFARLQVSLKDAHGEGARRLPYFEGRWYQHWIPEIQRAVAGVNPEDVTALGEDATSPATPGPGYIPPGTIVSAPTP